MTIATGAALHFNNFLLIIGAFWKISGRKQLVGDNSKMAKTKRDLLKFLLS